MTGANLTEMPEWMALIIVLFLLVGSGLTLLGAIGLVSFRNFYDRLHMPTLGTSWGIGAILIASLGYHSWLEGHLVVRELLITVFLVVTTPVTLMMLARAALHRGSHEWRDLPSELLELYQIDAPSPPASSSSNSALSPDEEIKEIG